MNRLRILAPSLAATVLAGCISVLPKEAPSQLYRFGANAVATPGTPATTSVAVQVLPLGFDRPASSDRILATEGDQVFYIRGGRWITSARSLFDAAIARAFNADGSGVKLLAWGQGVAPKYFLKVDVVTFEARYDRGLTAAPAVAVQIHASISNPSDRAMIREKIFSATTPATENRVAAIAMAFDQAVGTVLGQLVGWVDSGGAT